MPPHVQKTRQPRVRADEEVESPGADSGFSAKTLLALSGCEDPTSGRRHRVPIHIWSSWAAYYRGRPPEATRIVESPSPKDKKGAALN